MALDNYSTVAASGYRSIRNAIDESKVVVNNDILIDEHRLNAIIPMISSPQLFNGVTACDKEVLLRHRAQGIAVQSLGRNGTIDSTTPQECTTPISFGNWAVSQQKIAGIDKYDKCDFMTFWDNVVEKRNWVFDDYIDRIGLNMIASINSCQLDRCGVLDTGTNTAPIELSVDNSHEIFNYVQNIKFSNRNQDNLIMVVPSCYRGVFTANKEVNDFFRHCCSLSAPQFTGEFPVLNNIKVLFSDNVPYLDCGDGTKVYTISVFPMGVFGYASLVAHMEQIHTDANIKHFSFAERVLLKYAMGIADPTDYANFKVKFKLNPLTKTTCGV